MKTPRFAPIVALISLSAARFAIGAGEVTSDKWWAWQPIASIAPSSEDITKVGGNALDAVLMKQGVASGKQASPEVLRRRLAFDLTGLPPSTMNSARSSLTDYVQDLLKSPQFGEKWAQQWLDLVRYADSDGYKADAFRPQAWRYRDWVIQALNADMPYTEFLQWQLAGDLLHPKNPQALVATGFYRHCIYEYNNRDARTQWHNILCETVDTVGDVFLGMGLQCAKCHDHKYDPISQQDYYKLYACFAGMMWKDALPAVSGEEAKQLTEADAVWKQQQEPLMKSLQSLEAPYLKKVQQDILDKFPKDLVAIYERDRSTWTTYEQQLTYIVARQVNEEHAPPESKMGAQVKKEYLDLKKQLKDLEKTRPKQVPMAFCVSDNASGVPEVRIPGRNQVITAGFPAILGGGEAKEKSRLELARWLSRNDHPLTARVIVNRLWQSYFGKGLAANPSDFGKLGERPQLLPVLDFLASELIRHQWRLKPIHELIVTSRHYQSERTPRRLSAESIRDASLAVSGELDLKQGGAGESLDSLRRSVYNVVKRNKLDPILTTFDAPDAIRSTGERALTTTPLQSLLLANGPWLQQRAEAMAKRLLDDTEQGLMKATLIEKAYQRVFGRSPSSQEVAEALVFLREQAETPTQGETDGIAKAESPLLSAVTDLCHSLLNSSEFLYVE